MTPSPSTIDPAARTCDPAAVHKDWPLWIAGKPVGDRERRPVVNPYTGAVVGTMPVATAADVRAAIDAAVGGRSRPGRGERARMLRRLADRLTDDRETVARLITSESGLCLMDTRIEVERTINVFRIAADATSFDDSPSFPGDIGTGGKARRIFSFREPLSAMAAITPFNHPLNQVAHKVAPALAAGTPIVVKPSERTPLTALWLAEALYEAGVPETMLSVVTGDPAAITAALCDHPGIELIAFTGSSAVGRDLAAKAGYRRLVLELGGNDVLIVLDDADAEAAAALAVGGCFSNGGQRCTSVKRLLVHERVAGPFAEHLARRAAALRVGPPDAPDTQIGTVISVEAAQVIEERVAEAVAAGARPLTPLIRRGAQLAPVVLDHVPADCRLVSEETFGPVAPIIRFTDIADAIRIANDTPYGLSAGVCTNRMDLALRLVHELEVGGVNLWEVPGYRTEASPFGGIKASGLGIKEGIVEAVKGYSRLKTFSLPWAG